MTFDEVLGQVQALLQQEKRLSYRGLKRRFALDDGYLEDLKEGFDTRDLQEANALLEELAANQEEGFA
jgi:hypothetical protein